MAKVETMDVLVAMAKAILEVAGEAVDAPVVSDEEKATKPAKATKAKAEKKAQADADDADDDLEGKTTKELYQMCVDAGIKVPKYGKNKAFYIAALQGGDAEDAEDAEDDGEAEADDPYTGKTAKELFGMCKKRGIKVEAKQKADVYIELLKKADAAEAEADADDDWDDDDAEEQAPAPKKQAKQKPKAKAKKVEEPEEDEDDDDWDI